MYEIDFPFLCLVTKYEKKKQHLKTKKVAYQKKKYMENKKITTECFVYYCCVLLVHHPGWVHHERSQNVCKMYAIVNLYTCSTRTHIPNSALTSPQNKNYVGWHIKNNNQIYFFIEQQVRR